MILTEKRKVVKRTLQELTKTKSIKVAGNGEVELIFRFKPNELKNNEKAVDKLIYMVHKKLENFLALKYRNTLVQKSPNLSYNTYTRLVKSDNDPNAKKQIHYFQQDNNGKFFLASLSEIKLRFTTMPQLTKDQFNDLLNDIINEDK